MNIKHQILVFPEKKGGMGRITEDLKEPCEVILASKCEYEYIFQNSVTSVGP